MRPAGAKFTFLDALPGHLEQGLASNVGCHTVGCRGALEAVDLFTFLNRLFMQTQIKTDYVSSGIFVFNAQTNGKKKGHTEQRCNRMQDHGGDNFMLIP